MASLIPNGKQQYFDNAGNPLVGGKLFTYSAGTSNPKATFQDADGLVPNVNPVILDGRGEAVVFWSGAYKVILKDSLDNVIWSVDKVTETNLGSRTSTNGSAVTPAGSTAQRDAVPLPGYFRFNIDTEKFEGYGPTAWNNFLTSANTTTDIAEGTNLYFSELRVRSTLLTGLSLASSAAITAVDTVVSAFGRLQAQINEKVGLTAFKINFRDLANSFTSYMTNTNTAARTYLFPDKDGTVAMTSDVVAGGMVLLSTTVIGTPVANFDLLSAFSAAYDHYEITLTNVATGNTSVQLQLRLATGGVVDTAANYYTIAMAGGQMGNTSVVVLANDVSNVASGGVSSVIRIANANATARSKGGHYHSTYRNNAGPAVPQGQAIMFAYIGGAALSGFRLYCSAGNIDSGVVRVYGIKNTN